MVTVEKLSIYQRFEGDIDMWLRRASRREKRKMDDADWNEIARLEQRLHLVLFNEPAASFIRETGDLIARSVEPAAIEPLYAMVRSGVR